MRGDGEALRTPSRGLTSLSPPTDSHSSGTLAPEGWAAAWVSGGRFSPPPAQGSGAPHPRSRSHTAAAPVPQCPAFFILLCPMLHPCTPVCHPQLTPPFASFPVPTPSSSSQPPSPSTPGSLHKGALSASLHLSFFHFSASLHPFPPFSHSRSLPPRSSPPSQQLAPSPPTPLPLPTASQHWALVWILEELTSAPHCLP